MNPYNTQEGKQENQLISKSNPSGSIVDISCDNSLIFYSILEHLSYFVVGFQRGSLCVITPCYKKGDIRDLWKITTHNVPNIASITQTREGTLKLNRRDAIVTYRMGVTSQKSSILGGTVSPYSSGISLLFQPESSTILDNLNVITVRGDYLMTSNAILKLAHNRNGVETVWKTDEDWENVNFWLGSIDQEGKSHTNPQLMVLNIGAEVSNPPITILTRNNTLKSKYRLIDLKTTNVTEFDYHKPFFAELSPKSTKTGINDKHQQNGSFLWMITERSDNHLDLGIYFPGKGFFPKMKLADGLLTGFEFIDQNHIIVSVNTVSTDDKSWSGFYIIDLSKSKVIHHMQFICSGEIGLFKVVGVVT